MVAVGAGLNGGAVGNAGRPSDRGSAGLIAEAAGLFKDLSAQHPRWTADNHRHANDSSSSWSESTADERR